MNRRIGTMVLAGCAVLAAGPAAAGGAAAELSALLDGGCQPWLAGKPRADMQSALTAKGWESLDGALYSKSGDWGSMTVSLTGTEAPAAQNNPMADYMAKIYGPQSVVALKRACQVSLNNAADPWSTSAIADGAAAWVVGALPGAVKTDSGVVTIAGLPVDVTIWNAGGTKATLAVERTKQAAPNFDVLLKVEE